MGEVSYGLKDKVALITGGSRGIGREIAFMMAAEGARVLICARKQDSLDQTVKEFGAKGFEIASFPLHVAKSEQVKPMMETVRERLGGLDILVNNVGMNIFTPSIIGAEESLFDKIVDTNLKGTYVMCKHAVPLMKERKGGKIVNISTIAARRAAPGMGIYGIAKAAVDMMTKALAVELAPLNIQVNGIAPCMVRTDFSKPLWSNEAVHKEVVRSIPMGRIAETAEVAGAVLFLASSASNFITGEVMAVDGGSLAK